MTGQLLDSAPPLVEPADRLALVADGIAERGWTVLPGFLPPCVTAGLRREVADRRAAGRFRTGAVGRASDVAITPEIRSDLLSWIEPEDPVAAVNGYLLAMEDLRKALNARLYLGLLTLESQFSIYPIGTCYRRHLDRHRDSADRILSCVFYLNEGWRDADGGQLRLYAGGDGKTEGRHDVLPEAGLLVTFLSDRIPHEVLPTNRERLSIASWFRGRPRG